MGLRVKGSGLRVAMRTVEKCAPRFELSFRFSLSAFDPQEGPKQVKGQSGDDPPKSWTEKPWGWSSITAVLEVYGVGTRVSGLGVQGVGIRVSDSGG